MADTKEGTAPATPQAAPAEAPGTKGQTLAGQATTPPAPATPKADTPPVQSATPAGGDKEQKQVQPSKDGASEKLALKLPADSPLGAEAVERIAAEARLQGLSQEQAQALLEREHKAVAQFRERQDSDAAEVGARWKAETENDPEIGGDKLGANLELVRRVIDRYGDEEIKGFLRETPFGNNRSLIRFLARIGKSMASDSLVMASAKSGVRREAADVLYSEQNPKEG